MKKNFFPVSLERASGVMPSRVNIMELPMPMQSGWAARSCAITSLTSIVSAPTRGPSARSGACGGGPLCSTSHGPTRQTKNHSTSRQPSRHWPPEGRRGGASKDGAEGGGIWGRKGGVLKHSICGGCNWAITDSEDDKKIGGQKDGVHFFHSDSRSRDHGHSLSFSR